MITIKKLLLVCCIIVFPTVSVAQTGQFDVFSIDTSGFPTIKAKFRALDKSGNELRTLSAQNFFITENGIPRNVLNVSCPEIPPPPDLSSILIMDISGSMVVKQGNISNMDLAKTAARSWIKGLPEGRSECAITAFDNENYFIQDFTTNKQRLLDALVQLGPAGGTDYNKGLLLPRAGGLEVARHAKYKRVLIFLTDGLPESPPDENAIIALANQLEATIFCVTLGLPMPESLKTIAQKTGGKWYENVTNQSQAEDTYSQILDAALGAEPCKIEWMSDVACTTERNVLAVLPAHSAQSTHLYYAPDRSRIIIEVQPSSTIAFGAVPLGIEKDTVFKITARHSAVRISNISPSDLALSIIDYGGSPPPFILQDGESRILTIRFSPKDSSRIFGRFNIENNLCAPVYSYVSGGFPGKKSASQQLILTRPNGGEVYIVGSDTVISWEGVAPNDSVTLGYSIDSGKNWLTLSTHATSFQFPWHIPNTPSNDCLVRVEYRERTENQRRFQWAVNTFGEKEITTLTSTASTVDKNGNSYTCGAFRGTSTNDNITLTSYGSDDIYLAKYDSEGKQLWVHQAGSNFSDKAQGIVVNAEGEVFICGSFSGTADFGRGITLEHTGAEDIFIAKYDNDGTIVWAKSYASSTSEIAKAISLDNENNIYISGSHSGADFGSGIRLISRGGLDGFIAKFDPNGTILWAKSTGSGDVDDIRSVACDMNGNIYACGYFSGDVAYFEDDLRLTAQENFGNNRFLVKLNTNGSFEWAKLAGSEFVALDSLSNIYTCGRFEDELDLGNGIVLQNDNPERINNFIARFDLQGNALWASMIRGIGNNLQLTAIASTREGSTYICGKLEESGTIDFGNTIGFKSKGRFDNFLVNFTPEGIANWVEVLSEGGYKTATQSVSLDPRDNAYLSGIVNETMRFGDLRVTSTGTFLSKYYLDNEADQNDISDAVFSIVKPEAQSLNIDMGRVVIGSSKDSLIQSFVTNTGNYPVRIDAIEFSGANASDFQLVSGIPPFTIAVGGAHAVEFRFRPVTIGGHSARLSIITQADSLQQTITGVGFEPTAQVSSLAVDFGIVETGSIKDTIVNAVIRNDGIQTVNFTDAVLLGPDTEQFEILDGGGSFVLLPGGQYSMQLRFSPKYIGRTSGQIGFSYEGMAGHPAIVQLSGQGVGGNVHVMDDSAYVGDTREIKLMLGKVNSASFVQTAATSFRAKLAFSNSILTPSTKVLSDGITLTKSAGVDTITIIQNWDARSTELANIPMIVTLGDRVSTEIELLEFDWLDEKGDRIDYDTELQSGVFTVLGICPEGGLRLFDAEGTAQMMMVVPHPVQETAEVRFTTIEKGITAITLTDVLGRQTELTKGEYSIGDHSVHIPGESLTQGMYILTMQTPTQVFTQQVIIQK